MEGLLLNPSSSLALLCISCPSLDISGSCASLLQPARVEVPATGLVPAPPWCPQLPSTWEQFQQGVFTELAVLKIIMLGTCAFWPRRSSPTFLVLVFTTTVPYITQPLIQGTLTDGKKDPNALGRGGGDGVVGEGWEGGEEGHHPG